MRQDSPWESSSYSTSSEISCVLWNLRFINMFTRAHDLFLSWAWLIQSVFSHLCLGLSSGLFPLGFNTKACTFHISCPFHRPWFDHLNDVWWAVQIMKLLIMQFSLFPFYFLPLRTRCLPQHSIPEHCQLVLFPLIFETKFHTHTKL
jgi:hypothetical protein